MEELKDVIKKIKDEDFERDNTNYKVKIKKRKQ